VSGSDANEGQLERQIQQAVAVRGDNVKVLLVDDESLYLQSLKSEIRRGGALDGIVTVVTAQHSQGAMGLIEQEVFDVVVCDVDMGATSKNGYELVRDLRKLGVRAKICVHSNRSLPVDFKTAIEAGADAFFPKPMSRVHLLKIIESAVRGQGDKGISDVDVTKKPLVAIIEDDIFVREAWETVLKKDCRVQLFDGSTSFWAAMEQSPELLSAWQVIVTDYYFDGEDETGATVAERLKGRVSCPVVLCSNGEFPAEELALFAARIDKEPKS
jgi:CheY-like chemotaxis protein